MKNENYNIEDFRDNYDWQNAFGVYSYDREKNKGCLDFVKRVVCCDNGCNDAENWICVVELESGEYQVVDAGCDYTGWDCRSWGTSDIYQSEGEALANLTPEQAERLQVVNVGHI